MTCVAESGAPIASGDAILFTPPAPQTHDIIAASDFPDSMRDTLCTALAQAQYRPCLSITMAFAGAVDLPYHALVNTDRQHDLAWVAFEHDKHPTRVPVGQTLVTVQCAPTASRAWWDDTADVVAARILPQLRALINTPLPAPLWVDRQGWRYALPDRAADSATLGTYEQSHGVYFTGDSLVGLGRVQLAMSHGFATAQRMLAHLQQR